MIRWLRPLGLVALLGGDAFQATAADKVAVTINQQTISAYRTVDLEAAKKEAAVAKKPIAWIASSPKLLDGTGTIQGNGSKGATLHAFYALRTSCVLVFMDAHEENHKVLQLVDDALHTLDPHYTPPTVVFLDAEAKQVLTKVPYEKDFTRRAVALGLALEQIKKTTASQRPPASGTTNQPATVSPSNK